MMAKKEQNKEKMMKERTLMCFFERNHNRNCKNPGNSYN